MPTFRYTSNGRKTIFKFPASGLPKRVRVDGLVTTSQASTTDTVTLAVAPPEGVSVEVIYEEVRTVADLMILGTPGPSSGTYYSPQADALGIRGTNPASILAPPVITFQGETADNLVFTVDPAWGEATVNDAGQITASRK